MQPGAKCKHNMIEWDVEANVTCYSDLNVKTSLPTGVFSRNGVHAWV